MVGEMTGIEPSSVGYLVAFGGGLVSFVSPCVLPIVPVVLSVVTGTDITTVTDTTGRLGRVAREALLLVLGFSVMFVLIGLSATVVGQTLTHDKQLLTRVAGVVVIVMAMVLGGSVLLQIPGLGREARFHPDLSRFGPFAAPIAGAAFGMAWVPCVTPVLASVLTVSASGGNTAHAAALLALYSAGLGLPCLALSLAFGKLTGALTFVRSHVGVIMGISTLAMAGFGVLLFLDQFSWLTVTLEKI
jgi:cytochrome c-type biogenesis protein